MHIRNSLNDFLQEIARSADHCLKPYKHSVLQDESIDLSTICLEDFNEIILKIETRDIHGVRYPENDLDLEIFRSGLELNIMLAWRSFPMKPILWQGKHALWMDSNTGMRANTPVEGDKIESLARRLRSSFSSFLIE